MMQTGGKATPLSFDPRGQSGPLIASAATPWAGVQFEVHQTAPSEERVSASPPEGQLQVRVILDGQCEGVVYDGDQARRPFTMGQGVVSIHGGPTPVSVRVRGSIRTLVASVSETWLERMAHEGVPPRRGTHRLPGTHPLARQIALAMCEEVQAGAPSGPLVAESLSTALLAYVFGQLPPAPMRVRGALAPGQARHLKRYIEERLGEELHLEDLAAVCDLRPRHFSSLFRETFGTTPYRYVLERRLERGARLLATTAHDITEIALQTGFSSQSHFTTAFRRAYGLTPARYAMAHRRGGLQ
jgi:AraC family transcriptional regulator